MGVLAALAGNWKWAAWGLVAASLLVAGWTANGWRMKAAKADHLQTVLQAEMKARVEADAARVALGMQLSEAEAAMTANTKTITKKVKVYVPSDRNCDIPPTFRGMLEHARTGNVSPAADPVAPSAPVP